MSSAMFAGSVHDGTLAVIGCMMGAAGSFAVSQREILRLLLDASHMMAIYLRSTVHDAMDHLNHAAV